MKVVIAGGSGLIGRKLIPLLEANGHEVVAASRSTGVNVLTGEGVDEAVAGADVVVDVLNSPSFEPAAVLDFFQTSSRNLLKAEVAAGVKHHIALSIVGTDRVSDSGYILAKIAQEQLIQRSGIPYTIVRATQFYEFLEAIAAAGTVDGIVKVPATQFQPVAADDVATTLVEVAVSAPANAIVDLAGPEALSMAEYLRRFLEATGKQATVVETPDARYFGTALPHDELVPMQSPRYSGSTSLTDWLSSVSQTA